MRSELGESLGSGPATLEREVVCQVCGGHTACTGALTTTRRPYCATPVQRDDLKNVPADWRSTAYCRFGSTRNRPENIDRWIHSRWSTPNELKTYREIGSFEMTWTPTRPSAPGRD